MVQDQGRPLLDTVAMAVMELELKDRIEHPDKHYSAFTLTREEEAQVVAENAYILGMAMVRESVKASKEWEIVPVATPEKEEETET